MASERTRSNDGRSRRRLQRALRLGLGALAAGTLFGSGCSSGDDGTTPPPGTSTGIGGGSGTACSADGDCANVADMPYCDPDTGTCVHCLEGIAEELCVGVLTCCGTSCVETATNTTHCGTCDHACALPNAVAACSGGQCIVSSCEPGYEDCDLDPMNGCEGVLADGGCACNPGEEQSCYTGPSGTEGVGACQSGTRICSDDGTDWGPCEGEVLPTTDSCLNDVDDDCDGTVNNGYPSGDGCVCVPGDTQSCYDGPPGTLGVGPCEEGTQPCNQLGTVWGFCTGQVTPQPEICNNNLDEDCSGVADDSQDQDGDGWVVCDGDCCDAAGPNCADPDLVNPGAFEVPGNNVDDDCDGNVDNPLPGCDGGLASNSSNPLDYASAIDLCQITTENPPLPNRRWGVISGELRLADGNGSPAAASRAIRPGFGSAIAPQQGSSLAVLSTGNAADTNDSNPNFAPFQGGTDTGTSSGVPADWLAANGGNFPNAPGCPDPMGGNTAHNPVMLKLRIRVPTNAQSFSMASYFFSAEYPEYVCSQWNDFLVVLLDSSWNGSPPNPADKNLAFYDPPPLGPPYYPVGVNLAFGNTGLFKQCLNGPTGCNTGSIPGNTSTCQGTGDLVGTGFDTVNPPPQFGGDLGWCGASNLLGGGTDWLVTNGNVQPGETMELRIAVWDTGDGWYDSLVLLDDFVWSLNPSQPGTGE